MVFASIYEKKYVHVFLQEIGTKVEQIMTTLNTMKTPIMNYHGDVHVEPMIETEFG